MEHYSHDNSRLPSALRVPVHYLIAVSLSVITIKILLSFLDFFQIGMTWLQENNELGIMLLLLILIISFLIFESLLTPITDVGGYLNILLVSIKNEYDVNEYLREEYTSTAEELNFIKENFAKDFDFDSLHKFTDDNRRLEKVIISEKMDIVPNQIGDIREALKGTEADDTSEDAIRIDDTPEEIEEMVDISNLIQGITVAPEEIEEVIDIPKSIHDVITAPEEIHEVTAAPEEIEDINEVITAQEEIEAAEPTFEVFATPEEVVPDFKPEVEETVPIPEEPEDLIDVSDSILEDVIEEMPIEVEEIVEQNIPTEKEKVEEEFDVLARLKEIGLTNRVLIEAERMKTARANLEHEDPFYSDLRKLKERQSKL